ncbi:haloalkane dehalogenase [Modestobacter sp. NPDC049651]|uniref:haloalkane dehalogenase n=1 Tax=unclassified Modestobacter TaxID=2643866 RepID=UPI0033D52131
MATQPAPADDPFPRSRVRLGHESDRELDLTYVDAGQGDPIVFLHGNPTSSYLWRNVIPHVQHLGRCIAPDLIGMGDSTKLPDPAPGDYSFDRHSQFLSAFLEAVQATERVVLVGHEWGAALAFDWARKNPGAVRGIAFAETFVGPLLWADVPREGKPALQRLRSPDGEAAALDEDLVVEHLLPASTRRGLSAEAHDRYRRPYAEPADRWPTLEWPRQLPIQNAPPDVHDIVARYQQFLAHSDVPKLFVDADPGSVLVGRMRKAVRRWPSLTEVTVPAGHLVPEDAPDELGRALAGWIGALEGRGTDRHDLQRSLD